MLAIILASGSIESVAQFFTVIFIFLFVLALTYFTTRFVGKYQNFQGINKNFEAIETFRVTNNKYLQLVRVGTRYFVIAIGKDTITLVSEVDESEIDLTKQDTSDEQFKKIFDIAKEKIIKRGDK